MNLREALETLPTLKTKPENISDALLLLQIGNAEGIKDFSVFTSLKGTFYISFFVGKIILDIRFGDTFTVIEDWDSDYDRSQPKKNLNFEETCKELREWSKRATNLNAAV